jgi:hypothetical protein
MKCHQRIDYIIVEGFHVVGMTDLMVLRILRKISVISCHQWQNFYSTFCTMTLRIKWPKEDFYRMTSFNSYDATTEDFNSFRTFWNNSLLIILHEIKILFTRSDAMKDDQSLSCQKTFLNINNLLHGYKNFEIEITIAVA